jgi:putative hydrolase of the HAD superfamily
LIIFDLDDTLIDTSGAVTPYKFFCILEFLKQRGVVLPKDALNQMHLLNKECKTSKETIHLMLERVAALFLIPEALKIYTAPLPNRFIIPTTPGAKKVLERFKEKLYTLAIVTGGNEAFQREKLEKAGLEPLIFSKIAIPEDSQKGSHYEELLREFSVSPEQALVVGDRIWMDLAPARALGLRTAHIRWGRGLREKKEEWVDHSIASLEELLEQV